MSKLFPTLRNMEECEQNIVQISLTYSKSSEEELRWIRQSFGWLSVNSTWFLAALLGSCQLTHVVPVNYFFFDAHVV